MSYEITCPYCFKKMQDDEVCFRSEIINRGVPDYIPTEYGDIEEFRAKYRRPDREALLSRLDEWELFSEKDDPVYEDFWKKYSGTTEDSREDDKRKDGKSYRRPVIDPAALVYQRYLKKQPDGSFFIRDEQGMVSQIELELGNEVGDTRCIQRVCRHCHNPLPDDYGKNPVKFITLVGVSGAGKTVYLSQLLYGIGGYAAKAGLSTPFCSVSAGAFRSNNSVVKGEPLPGSTPPTKFQQPLFYDISRSNGMGGTTVETLVLYDVAGEIFKDVGLVRAFAPFVQHSDGIIMLIDPLQFKAISGLSEDGRSLEETTTALQQIHHLVSHGKISEKCSIPMAVCISKADTREVRGALDTELCELLREDVEGIKNARGFCKPIFNAKQYAPIGEKLERFILEKEPSLGALMENNYSSYAYFAFTALGCDVKTDGGKTYPLGPIIPKRIEEPMLWMFHKFGYIGKNAALPGDIVCSICGSIDTSAIPEDEQAVYVRDSLFRHHTEYVNRRCNCCRHTWWHISDAHSA